MVMPWKPRTIMSERLEFIQFAVADNANIRDLCRRYGISPKTGYKWIARFTDGGINALEDKSRRPRRSPRRTSQEIEAAVVRLRDLHQVWGGRTIERRLITQGYKTVPRPSTITGILHRHGRINPDESTKHMAWQRFEAPSPNELWQMDFKGHFPLLNTQRCHPLTVLDDHSRYALGLYACAAQTHTIVQNHLITIFRRYGLPWRLLVDNGPPWGTRDEYRYTALTVWLIRLGVTVSHASVCHPQTLGKDERFHRTLKAEVITNGIFPDLVECQRQFDLWRTVYNFERPHQALNMNVPGNRYQHSARIYPETLPSIEYGADDLVRKVQAKGEIHFQGKVFLIGKAFHQYPIALRPTLTDGVFDVFFCNQNICTINLNCSHEQPF
jgi:transposase InsO family protein